MEPDPGNVVSSFLVKAKEGRGTWRASFDVDGQGRRVRLCLSSADDPPREITGALLRDLGTRFGDLKEADADLLRGFYQSLERDAREDVKARAKARKLLERQEPKRKGRPRTYDLAKVAEAYSAAVARKDPAPLAAVVKTMPGLSRPYASKLVAQAADRGYLPEEYRPK